MLIDMAEIEKDSAASNQSVDEKREPHTFPEGTCWIPLPCEANLFPILA